jgi:hypothetical protein
MRTNKLEPISERLVAIRDEVRAIGMHVDDMRPDQKARLREVLNDVEWGLFRSFNMIEQLRKEAESASQAASQ